MSTRDPICYINGAFVLLSGAHISAQDLGLLRGIGVFDFLRTYALHPFELDAHVRRLANSAQLVGIRLPMSQKKFAQICRDLCARNADLKEVTLRLIVTAGPTSDGFWPDGAPTVAILVAAQHNYPAKLYRNGCGVITTLLSRELPEAKTTNYVSARAALVEAKKVDAVEALYVNPRGDVLEGTTSNIFAVQDGTLITPCEGILSGITREVVLKIVRQKTGLMVREEPLPLATLRAADEAFLTSSNREVMPVTEIDGRPIGDQHTSAAPTAPAKVGPVTRRVMALFRAYTRRKAGT